MIEHVGVCGCLQSWPNRQCRSCRNHVAFRMIIHQWKSWSVINWVHCLISFSFCSTSAQIGSAQAGFAIGELQNRTTEHGSLREIEPALASSVYIPERCYERYSHGHGGIAPKLFALLLISILVKIRGIWWYIVMIYKLRRYASYEDANINSQSVELDNACGFQRPWTVNWLVDWPYSIVLVSVTTTEQAPVLFPVGYPGAWYS